MRLTLADRVGVLEVNRKEKTKVRIASLSGELFA
jgi:hypothetical protein